MKMWVIPWPHDDGEEAALVVLAESREDAITSGMEYITAKRARHVSWWFKPAEPHWDKTEEAGSVYENSGCSE